MSNLSNYPISSLQPAWTPDECVLAAPIYIDIEVNHQNGSDLSFSTLSNFLSAFLPAPLINEASPGVLCDWWANSWVTNANDTGNFVNAINANCSSQVCDAVDWPGDPDIAGIGMIVVYGTLLAIVYIYAVAEYVHHIMNVLTSSDSAWTKRVLHVLEHIVYIMKRILYLVKSILHIPKPLGLLGRYASYGKTLKEVTIDPFEGTIQDLLDLCLSFAITSEISTIAFHSQAVTRYEMVIAELLCLFASSASAILWIFHSESGRFRITRFVLFIISVFLPIPVIIVHATMREQMAKDFVMMCVDMKLDYITTSRLRDRLMFSSWATMFVFQIGISVIILPQAVYNYVLELQPDDSANICGTSRSPAPTSNAFRFLQWCRQRRLLSKWYGSVRPVHRSKWFQSVCAIGTTWGCIVMLASFVEILKMRNRMREAAGSGYIENAWGFGQIYALTTWFPLLPAWLSIALKGSQNGFNNRLPEAWKAIKKSMAACNCASGHCQCRKHSQQNQTDEKATSLALEYIANADADADADVIEADRTQEVGVAKSCCN